MPIFHTLLRADSLLASESSIFSVTGFYSLYSLLPYSHISEAHCTRPQGSRLVPGLREGAGA